MIYIRWRLLKTLAWCLRMGWVIPPYGPFAEMQRGKIHGRLLFVKYMLGDCGCDDCRKQFDRLELARGEVPVPRSGL